MSLDTNNGGSMVSSIMRDLEEPAHVDEAPVTVMADVAGQDVIVISDDDDIEVDDSFSLEGFQVVRREFFAHTFEPSISMQDNKIGFNMAALRKMPDAEFVQFLVNSDTKQLVIVPCEESAPECLLWCSKGGGKRKPRHVSGRFFFLKITELMGWNPNNRFKILGKFIRSNGKNIFLFNLEDAEQYKREKVDGNKIKTTRTPIYPSDWKNHFGVPYEEHKASLQINLLDGFAVMGIKEKVKEAAVVEPEATTLPSADIAQSAVIVGGGDS